MSIFNKKKVAAAPVPPPAPVVQAAPAPAPVAPSGPNAPWAVEGCGACKGKGINSKGNPCQACYHIRKRRGESTVDDYDVHHDDQGNLCWKAKSGVAAPAPVAPKVEAQAPVAPPAEGKAAIVQPAKEKKAKAPRVVAPEIKEAPPPQTEQPTPALAADSGLGVGGFRLFLNCMPVGASFVDASDLLAREGAEMAKEFEVASYYDLDAFKRRDLLASAASQIADDLEGQDLVAVGGGQDVKALVDALKPLAAQIIQGVF